jgi:hypothetical protein
MKEYYHISQLTGRGYEVLLDAVDGSTIACFYCGTIVALGVNPVMEDIRAIANEETKAAA